MIVWNVHLGQRLLSIKVRKVLQKELDFMVIIDSRKRQHKLSEVDFPSSEWAKIGVGSTINLTISESVTRWRVKPPRVEKSIKELIVEIKKKASGYFFIWICQYCGTNGYVEYEEGDDFQRIAERIVLAHRKEAKAGCKKDIRIFDHRGIEQKDSALFLSSRLAGG